MSQSTLVAHNAAPAAGVAADSSGVQATAARPAVPAGRAVALVLGAALGLCCSFPVVFNSTLPFFLLPLGQEFGWGRGDTSAAAVLAMLGVTLASPLAGRLFDRFGAERVILVSVLLYAAGVWAMSLLPGRMAVVGGLCFAIGVAGCGTTMIGYAGVLARWFDQRLGMALGMAGLGAGIGVGCSPFIATRLIAEHGWRGAYEVLAGIVLVGGLLAFWLLRPRGGVGPATARAHARAASTAAQADLPGLTLQQARRDPRFWLLFLVTFLVPFSILGIALHGAALFIDRGLTPQQAAVGAAVAGLGAIVARVGVGVLLDRMRAPWIASVIFIAAGAGLLLNSSATSFALLCVGTILGGVAMGAEGDLLPFMIRRYFGLKAFGAVFGLMHSAYALGGVLGPVAYGYAHDRLNSYVPIMLGCAALCGLSALAVLMMGSYRFSAETVDGAAKPRHG